VVIPFPRTLTRTRICTRVICTRICTRVICTRDHALQSGSQASLDDGFNALPAPCVVILAGWVVILAGWVVIFAGWVVILVVVVVARGVCVCCVVFFLLAQGNGLTQASARARQVGTVGMGE
jgi:hypothetical protein